MGLKFQCLSVFAVACILLINVQGSFIKVKNVPRVGRSNEADGFSNGHEMAYVIKTMPKNNIPRMGRRNFDLENRYDIPKLNDISIGSSGVYEVCVGGAESRRWVEIRKTGARTGSRYEIGYDCKIGDNILHLVCIIENRGAESRRGTGSKSGKALEPELEVGTPRYRSIIVLYILHTSIKLERSASFVQSTMVKRTWGVGVRFIFVTEFLDSVAALKARDKSYAIA
ncbi:hypothetical protein EVAR_100046_1 [Eumeta japonica]|uniref:Uncharacterized protein n=1 Tax=Eumeta variegata TaxID=151549 RepID=A0A4C1ZXF3_EUMVA|nr:hypothetical protein EVAR_100046_1 [Eumeta japonica]